MARSLFECGKMTQQVQCRLYGQRTTDWGRTANPENTVLTSAEVTDLIAGVEIIANDKGKSYDFELCRFHGSERLSSDTAKNSWPVEFGLDSISCLWI